MSSSGWPRRRLHGKRQPSAKPRGLGINPRWNARRVDVMRWVLRVKREANHDEIDALLAATG